jgi:hypothetical protein
VTCGYGDRFHSWPFKDTTIPWLRTYEFSHHYHRDSRNLLSMANLRCKHAVFLVQDLSTLPYFPEGHGPTNLLVTGIPASHV